MTPCSKISTAPPGYAELHCLSNFTFRRGASHPEELVARAHDLGYAALALTDECSLTGMVRAHVAAKQHGLKLIVGSEVRLADGPRLVLLAAEREGYGNLAQRITRGRRAAAKGDYHLSRADLEDGLPGCLALLLPGPEPDAADARWLAQRFPGRAWLAAELLLGADDSAWLKRHETAAFACALLNSQPMGFYGPSQLVQDARRHGVKVRPADVPASDWDCTLEGGREPALRLGLRMVKGLSRAGANRQVAGIERPPPLLLDAPIREGLPCLAAPGEGEELLADYASLGLTLGRHPLALLRDRLRQRRMVTAAQLRALPNGRLVRTAGLVTCRQRPDSAGGVIFVTLEDETGLINVVVWRDLAQRQRRELLGSTLPGVYGKLERQGEVVHVVAGRLADHSEMLAGLPAGSRDFC